VGRVKIRALFGEERSARLDRDVTSGARSANAQEPGADRALDLFEGPAEHLGGLVESEPLARAEDPRHALPVTHNRQRPTRIPTNLHAHGVTEPLSLRHTFASRLVMAGVDLMTVMQLGGWKSLAMVQRYGHLSPSHRPDAIEHLVSPPAAVEIAAVAGAE